MKVKFNTAHNWLRGAEIGYGALVLFVLTIGPIFTLWRNAQLGNPALPIEAAHLATFVGVQLPALFLLGKRVTPFSSWKSAEWYLSALVGWLLITALASDTGAYAVGNSVKSALCVTTGLYLATSFSRQQQLVVVTISMHIGVIISRFAIARNWPDSIFESREWSGIYVNPNLLGPVAAMAAVSLLLLAMQRFNQIPREWRIAVAVLVGDIAIFDVVMLFHTKAFTSIFSSLIVLVIVATAFGINRFVPRDKRNNWWGRSVATLSVGFALSMLVLYKFSSLVSGKLLTKSVLQERIFAWRFSWTGFMDRPWLGWGQGVAWSNQIFRRLNMYWTVENIGHSHSAYFDVLLSGGVLAGVFFCAYLATALYRLMKLETPQQSDVVRLSLIFFCLIAALFEPFIATNYFMWPILVMALAPDKQINY